MAIKRIEKYVIWFVLMLLSLSNDAYASLENAGNSIALFREKSFIQRAFG